MRLTLGLKLILNKDKFDWETMNTRKIKVVFNAAKKIPNDYGTRIQIKCHQKIERISQTLDGGKCVNWEFVDSFGKLFDFYTGSVLTKFYQSVNWRGIGLRLNIKYKDVMSQNL